MSNATDKRKAAARIAIDIERLLVWTYRDQRADVGGGAVSLGFGGSTLAQLGSVVDGGAGVNAVAEDAFTVHLHVLRLGDEVARRVIYHGRTATRPDWIVHDQPRPWPMSAAAGGVEVIEVDTWPQAQGRGRRSRSHVCPVHWHPSPESVEVARQIYAAWRDGLAVLVGMLRKQGCTRYAVTSTLPPANPWLDRVA